MAALIFVGLVLIIVGFRRAPVRAGLRPGALGDPPQQPADGGRRCCLLGLGHSKSRAKGWLRNPMLTAVVVWAVAHLLVNGDVASLVMFGWLGLWAVARHR